jgi:hypothetical protein
MLIYPNALRLAEDDPQHGGNEIQAAVLVYDTSNVSEIPQPRS